MMIVRRVCAGLVFALAATARVAAAQQPDSTTADTLRVLLDRVELLDQQIRIIERKAELQRAGDSARAALQPVTKVGTDGVTFTAADGSFSLRVRGYVHQDARFYAHDATNGTDAFLLRRVRPVFEATAGIFEFKLMPDFGLGAPLVQDAYFGANFSPKLRLRAGKFKAPVGLERLVSATAIRFVERGFPTSLIPNRDVGVMLHGEFGNGVLGYALGAFNGVADGGSADTDTNDSKEIAARLYTSKLLRGLTIGVAGTRGRNSGALPSYKTPGQIDWFTFRPLAANGPRDRITTHFSLYRGRVGALGEWVRARQHVQVDAAARAVTATAWQLSGGYVLTGEDNGAAGVRPRVALDPARGTWGALELIGRVHAFNMAAAVFPALADPNRSATAARAFGCGIDWYWSRNVKLVVNYEHTSFDGGAIGRDRPAENLVFTRFQFAY